MHVDFSRRLLIFMYIAFHIILTFCICKLLRLFLDRIEVRKKLVVSRPDRCGRTVKGLTPSAKTFVSNMREPSHGEQRTFLLRLRKGMIQRGPDAWEAGTR